MSYPPFQLDASATEPLYRQLMAQVRRFVASGLLRPGSELPSVRELAQNFAINPMTVSKAYSLLEAEGVLIRPRGARMQVADFAGARLKQSDRVALLRQAQELGLSHKDVEIALRSVLDEAPS